MSLSYWISGGCLTTRARSAQRSQCKYISRASGHGNIFYSIMEGLPETHIAVEISSAPSNLCQPYAFQLTVPLLAGFFVENL